MEIRRANEADVGGILRLLSEVLEIHAEIRPDIFISGTTKYTENELVRILADDSRPVYVAIGEGGEVSGYAFCIIEDVKFANTMHKRKTLFIDDLCVDRAVRGTGIGKRLFDYVKAQAKSLGCDEITLAVWEGNDKARRFYGKMGMTPRETIMELKI